MLPWVKDQRNQSRIKLSIASLFEPLATLRSRGPLLSL